MAPHLIAEELREVNGKLDEFKGDIGEVRSRVAKIDVLLTGNGHPERGLVLRMDRMEQIEINRKSSQRRMDNYLIALLGAAALNLSGFIAAIAWLVTHFK